jgi:CRISPR-associated protein (TIGR02584 family)
MPAKPKSSNISVTPTIEKIVLVAITGMSPAVLTETVWALAEKEKIIPDLIVVLTTVDGHRKLVEQLFGSDDIWKKLRADILGPGHAKDMRLNFSTSPSCLRIMERMVPGGGREPINDMNRLADNEAVGDEIVAELWRWTKPGYRVLASLSGGFKTMSAMMYAGMTLLGRPGDRILHVLVNEPYAGNTAPPFFWPGQPMQELSAKRAFPELGVANGQRILANDAVLNLGDIQFPPLSQLTGWREHTQSPSFAALVERCRSNSALSGETPIVKSLILNVPKRTLSVNGSEPWQPGAIGFQIIYFLARACQSEVKYTSADRAATAYLACLQKEIMKLPHDFGLLKPHSEALSKGLKATGKNGKPDAHRYSSALSDLRTTLEELGEKGSAWAQALAEALPFNKRHSLTLTKEQVTIEK